MKIIRSVHTLELTEHDRLGLIRDIEVFFMGNQSSCDGPGIDGAELNSLYGALRSLDGRVH